MHPTINPNTNNRFNPSKIIEKNKKWEKKISILIRISPTIISNSFSTDPRYSSSAKNYFSSNYSPQISRVCNNVVNYPREIITDTSHHWPIVIFLRNEMLTADRFTTPFYLPAAGFLYRQQKTGLQQRKLRGRRIFFPSLRKLLLIVTRKFTVYPNRRTRIYCTFEY